MPRQLDLPGTEPIADAELAKRRAEQPLKPDAPQESCDIGLFGDEAAQTDLMDLAYKRLKKWAAERQSRDPATGSPEGPRGTPPGKHHDETT
jgi:hypothetical protein